ncbi:YqaJ viral recombinase family protein [Marinobacterium aestuariivivens]|uniref:YqaJ viral recombinase family protein n=1 Tax=Marinobacterium aestuariivivens TaxID=1698799 RepID=A0ABW2A9W2_9GAMM
MKIINLSQRDDDWLEWRRGGITATDATILLNRSPYKTRWRLWAEKTGYAREVDLSLNPLVRRGVQNEDKARQAFEAKHNDLLLPACVESAQNPLMRASLDGLTGDGEPAELKCPSESVWKDVCANGVNSKPYQLYYAQVQHQLLVTDAAKGWLVFWYEGEIREFVITRDEAMLNELLVQAKEFWQQVLERKEPEKDPERDLYIPHGKQAERWISAAEEYRIYDAEIQELKQRLSELQDKQKPLLDDMKSLMGEYFHADYGGVMVTRYKVAGRVNYKKLLEEKASGVKPDDIDKYRDEAGERCRVTVTDSVKPRYIVDEEVLAPLDYMSEEVESSYF